MVLDWYKSAAPMTIVQQKRLHPLLSTSTTTSSSSSKTLKQHIIASPPRLPSPPPTSPPCSTSTHHRKKKLLRFVLRSPASPSPSSSSSPSPSPSPSHRISADPSPRLLHANAQSQIWCPSGATQNKDSHQHRIHQPQKQQALPSTAQHFQHRQRKLEQPNGQQYRHIQQDLEDERGHYSLQQPERAKRAHSECSNEKGPGGGGGAGGNNLEHRKVRELQNQRSRHPHPKRLRSRDVHQRARLRASGRDQIPCALGQKNLIEGPHGSRDEVNEMSILDGRSSSFSLASLAATTAAPSSTAMSDEAQKPSEKRKLRSTAESERVEDKMARRSRAAAAEAGGPTQRRSHSREASEPLKDPASASLSTKGDSYRPAPSMESLQGILHRLQKKDKFGVFAEPVDPNEAPNYYDIIKQPMDFNTVSKRIASGYYTTLASFESDIFTICNNAMTYNSKGTVYFRHAKAIKQIAEKILKEMGVSDSTMELDEFQLIEKDECATSDHEARCDTELVLEDGLKDHDLGETKGDFSSGNVSPSECPESSVQNAKQSFSVDSLSETSDFEEDTSGSFPWSSQYSKSPRSTYVPLSASCEEPDTIVSTISGEQLLVLPVGSQQLDFPYARSLAQFAAELGPFVWKVATEKIQTALPSGCLFGPGWVMDSEAPLDAEPDMQVHPNSGPNQEGCLKLSDCPPTKSAIVPNEIQPSVCCRSFMAYNHQSKEQANVEPIPELAQQDNGVSSAASSNSQQDIGLNSAASSNPPSIQINQTRSSSMTHKEIRAPIPTISSSDFQVNEEFLSRKRHQLTLPGRIGIDIREQQITDGSQLHTDTGSQNTSHLPRENTWVSTQGSLKGDQELNTLTSGKLMPARSVVNHHERLRALEQQSCVQSNISDMQTILKATQDHGNVCDTRSWTTADKEMFRPSQQSYVPSNHQDIANILNPGNLKMQSQQPHMQFDNQETINMSNVYSRCGASSQESLQTVGWSQKAFGGHINMGSTVNLNHPVTDNVMLSEYRTRDDMIKNTDGTLNTKNSLNAYPSASAAQTSTSPCLPFLGNIQMNARFNACMNSQMDNASKLFGGRCPDVNDKTVSRMELRNHVANSTDNESTLCQTQNGKSTSSITIGMRNHNFSNDIRSTEGSVLSRNLNAPIQSPLVSVQGSCAREVNHVKSAQTISSFNYSNVNHMQVPSFNSGILNSSTSDPYNNIQSAMISYNLNAPIQQCSDLDTRNANLPDSGPNSIYQISSTTSAHNQQPLPNLKATTTSSSASSQTGFPDVNVAQFKDPMSIFYRDRFTAASDVDERGKEAEHSASTAENSSNARRNFKAQVVNINTNANSQDGNHAEHAAYVKYSRFHEKQGHIGGSPVNFSTVSSPSSGVQQFRENQGMPGWLPLQQMDITGTGAMKNVSQLSRSTATSAQVQPTQCAPFRSPCPVTPSVHRGSCVTGDGNQKHVSNFPHFLQQHVSEGFDSSIQNDCVAKQMNASATTGSTAHYMRSSESCWNPNPLMHTQVPGRHLSGIPQNGNQLWHFVGSHMVSPQEKASFSGAPDLNVSLAHNKSIFDQSAGNEVQQPDLELQL